MPIKKMVAYLKSYQGRPLKLMEVCGTHTAALHQSGIRNILPPSIQLLSGPGCPVCVTPTAYIDRLIALSQVPKTVVLSFGDMLGVPGSKTSLAGARSEGGHCDFFYAPEDALKKASEHPELNYVLAAVGFETTAPVWATLATEIKARHLTNIKLLTALKTMPQAMESICQEGDIDGFLCPGHVAVITGSEAFRFLAERYHKPMVVGGFTPELLVRALCRLVKEASEQHSGLWNEYPQYVRPLGNIKAQGLLKKVFEPGPAVWRGIGNLSESGLYLRAEYADLDAGSRNLTEDTLPQGCSCGLVLTGKLTSQACPLFGKACTPTHPVGACMVSSEGSCRINYYEAQK
jgi:hydrogenase expression/formation protein HypD